MWLSNPLASPLAWTTLGSVGGLLLMALAALVWVEGGALWRSALLRRWAVWALIAPLYLVGVLSGPLVAAVFAAALGVQAAREYAALAHLPRAYRRLLLGAAPLPALATLAAPDLHAVLPLAFLLAATLVPIARAEVHGGVRHLALTVFGWLYLPWLLAYLPLLQRDVPGGAEALLALGLAVALADVGAYCLGHLCGGPPLAPTISPRKTWGGVAGALLGAAAGLVLLRAALPAELSVGALLGLALVVGVGAVWGDLVESLLKRECGVKDAGAWLPGFGGLLDRVDSLVLVLPLAYWYLRGVLS